MSQVEQGPQFEQYHQARQIQEDRPAMMGGAVLGGLAAGSLLGPIAAIVGCAVGGTAGYILDRRAYNRAMQRSTQ